MDLQSILSEKGADWIRLLVDQVGMQEGQAESFLPAAARVVAQVLEGGELDLSKLLGGSGLGELLGGIDVGALAGEAGVDAGTASKGLEALAPELLAALGGAGDASDLLGAAGGLAKKLFG